MNLGLRTLLSTCAIWLATSSAWARRDGYASIDCRSCHTGNVDVQLTIAFSPEQPSPGQLVTLTVTVSAEAAVAGIAIASNGLGSFSIPDGESLDTEDIWVTHVRPKAASDGEVRFDVEWQAPDEPGIADFNVAVVAANGNNAPTGDGTRSTLVALPFGCDVIEVYADADGDGHGDPALPTEVACSAALGYAASGDDCDDQNATAHPGAIEQCNDVDDDCDGEIDQDVAYRPYYFDNDHDGFGNLDVVIEGCALPEGAVENALDCDDFSRDTSPGSPELCDGRDNDCNGEIDDDACPATQRCVDAACVDSCGAEGCNAVEMPTATAAPEAPSVSVPGDDDPAVGPSSSGVATTPTPSSSAAPSADVDTDAAPSSSSTQPLNDMAQDEGSSNATSGCAMRNHARYGWAALWLPMLAAFARFTSRARRAQSLTTGFNHAGSAGASGECNSVSHSSSVMR